LGGAIEKLARAFMPFTRVIFSDSLVRRLLKY
jgi:hypothetical protein